MSETTTERLTPEEREAFFAHLQKRHGHIPTRDDIDGAWNRLAERVEEEPLQYCNDLLTVADGLALLRDRVAELTDALEFIADWAHDCAGADDSGFYGFGEIEERANRALKGDASE